MVSLKLFLDQLAGEGHPFRGGPELKEGSALPAAETRAGVQAIPKRSRATEEQKKTFYFMRFNKN